MSGGHENLLARRARLVARAAAQRDDLAAQLGAWQGAIARVDRGLAWLGALRRSAPWIGVGLGVLLAGRALSRPPALVAWERLQSAAWRLGSAALGAVTGRRRREEPPGRGASGREPLAADVPPPSGAGS